MAYSRDDKSNRNCRFCLDLLKIEFGGEKNDLPADGCESIRTTL